MPIYNNITTRRNGLFQGSCPRSTDRKMTPISLARYTISSQSDMETNSSSRCYSVRIWFQTIIIQNFVHQQRTTKHKVQGEVRWKSIGLKIMAACACHHPDSALYWLECRVTLKIGSHACRFLLLLLQEQCGNQSEPWTCLTSSHFAYSDTAMWPRCVWDPKIQFKCL